MLSVFKAVRLILKLYGTGLGLKVLLDLVPEPPSLTHLTNPSKNVTIAIPTHYRAIRLCLSRIYPMNRHGIVPVRSDLSITLPCLDVVLRDETSCSDLTLQSARSLRCSR